MPKNYKVIYERNNCIGAAQCVAVMPELWKLNADGKADLKGSKTKDGKWEMEIDDKMLEKMKDAASSCPVNVIHIIETKTGKRII